MCLQSFTAMSKSPQIQTNCRAYQAPQDPNLLRIALNRNGNDSGWGPLSGSLRGSLRGHNKQKWGFAPPSKNERGRRSEAHAATLVLAPQVFLCKHDAIGLRMLKSQWISLLTNNPQPLPGTLTQAKYPGILLMAPQTISRQLPRADAQKPFVYPD